jgi:hypothetical protein
MEMKGGEETAISDLVNAIWDEQKISTNMNKKQCHNFFNTYIRQFDESMELSDEAFEEMFKLLDEDKDELVTKIEMIAFIDKFTS